jgi:amino acid adenylation domain-containing protein
MKPIYLLPQAVLQAAERTPDQEAVRCFSKSLTYQELATRALALARTLHDQGVRRGDRVGIYMNKSVDAVVGIYGAMLAGAAYVPLDPFAPPARLRFVIQDCGIRWLITHPNKTSQLQEIMEEETGLEYLIGMPAQDDFPAPGGPRAISWEDVGQQGAAPLPDLRLVEQDLAYILYTSGSTGTPKGIMHTHRSGLSFANWSVNTYQITAQDRLSNHAPFHFDLSTFDLFAAHRAGAATVLIPEAVTKLPASLSKLMADEKLSVWYSVPFALIQLLQHGGLPARDLSHLRWILFAGELFPTKHLRAIMNTLPHVRFSNLYGPTETNVCTYYHVPPLPEDSDEPISIGRACENVEDLVVDSDGQPVAPGETGELLIRGGVVMRGYWGRPELTQRGFYLRPAQGYLNDIFYRTGDLVQQMPDGNYKFLGRKDRQIKTRGYRVELDEIETNLLAHPQVNEAAVYPVPDGQGSNLIEAGVTLKEGAAVDPSELTGYLAGLLPPYAVPARIHISPDFPRTSTGKIDRRALAERAENAASQPSIAVK